MSDVSQRTSVVLAHVASQLRATRLLGEFAGDMEQLAAQVQQPCVVAVVGRVKAGKSTFVNALLDDDLAKVGTTETTATINFFRYGNADPARPVRCHWRGGNTTDEDRAFLDSLQGNDTETLRRADGIEYLEYFLPNPWLRQITLVDTPGTGAVVGEHQSRTAEFLKLHSQLRNRHHLETERLGNEADAVIYLVGPVARTSDKAFFDEFAQVVGNQSRVFNAIGVLAKIDLQPEILERRRQLAQKISSQLHDKLNTVIPVSAAVYRALNLLKDDQARLINLREALRRIPSARLEMLLDSEELFRELEFDDCPVTTIERRDLLGDISWGAFTTIARVVADGALTPQQAIEQLHEISGFDTLKKVLEERFINRGQILRCYRMVNDARAVLRKIRLEFLPQYRKYAREDEAKLNRFLTFIRQHDDSYEVARELQSFLLGSLSLGAQLEALGQLWKELEAQLGKLFHELLEYNADFDALQLIRQCTDKFSVEELDELRSLLGLYGVDVEKRLVSGSVNIEYVRERQLVWRRYRETAPQGAPRRLVAERAYTRYGLILDQLLSIA